MEQMSDEVLLEELTRRFSDTKKALQDMKVMNAKIEKLNNKLAESERLKTNFLSNIRNEINNPLTAILGLSAELSVTGKDEKTRLMMAQMIHQEAFALDFQLRNIFLAAELEAGEAVTSAAQVDIAALVKSLIPSFRHKSDEKGLTVRSACSTDRPDGEALLFTTDPEKLDRIIANLLANAIEYSPPGKAVAVEARREKDRLIVTVADQGEGIPEHERQRLFERFHQLDQGSSKKHRGHGLGLSITKALVTVLAGVISVSDAAGGGCLVTVSIPEAADDSGIFAEDGNEFLFESGNTF
jgi:signal transduction histidine kinase